MLAHIAHVLPARTIVTQSLVRTMLSWLLVTSCLVADLAYPPLAHSQQTASRPSAVQTAATFRRLQQDCLSRAPIVEELRASFGLNICEIASVYQDTVDSHRRARDAELQLLEFVVLHLTRVSLDDLPSGTFSPVSFQRTPDGHRYRLLAPPTASDLTREQKLRWVGTLALVDRYVDPDLIRRIEEGIPLDEALQIALGPTGYAYVDFTERLPGTPTSATERERADARARDLRGTAFAVANDGSYWTLDPGHIANGRIFARRDATRSLLDYLDIINTAVVTTAVLPRGLLVPVVPMLPYQYEYIGPLIVEHGWDSGSTLGLDTRPGANAVEAIAAYANAFMVSACRQRLGDRGEPGVRASVGSRGAPGGAGGDL